MNIKNAFLLTILIFGISISCAQERGTKERIKVYSLAIEGNLIGDSPDRDVTVYLPPSYQEDEAKRYPVLYLLHGYTDNDSKWFGWEDHWINVHDVIDASLNEGLSSEMIVVMPNAYNTFKGSMYSSSITIGDWETFVTRELVDYIDSNYRTRPHRDSRGLAGHSMGGYGTLRLGMKYPDIFAAIYAMSPCCMEGGIPANPEFEETVREIDTKEKLEKGGFFLSANLATLAAFAPDPDNPPFFIEMPVVDGEPQPHIIAEVHANRIHYMLDQYIFNLRKLEGIAIDAGDRDGGIAPSTMTLHERLDKYGVQHFYESYDGDHLSGIADRIRTEVLPFFSQKLVFE